MSVTLLTTRKCPTDRSTLSTARNTRYGLAYSLLLLVAMSQTFAAEVESLEAIRLNAEKHALRQVDTSHFAHASAVAGTLDTRLQLKKCDTPLETFSTGAMNNASRMTVGVRCGGLNPWTLYVPVMISALVDVVFSTRSLSRGALLEEEDFEVQQIPMNKLPIGYLSDPSEIASFELTRTINAGIPITLNAVRPRDIIQQGQEVIIRAQLDGLQVKMAGEALKNGRSGDLIPVKNLRSGRTVEATILDSGTVSVNL